MNKEDALRQLLNYLAMIDTHDEFKALISSRIRSFISGTPPFGNIIAHKSTAVKKKVAR